MPACSYRGAVGRISIGQNVGYEKGSGKRYFENGELRSEFTYEVWGQDEEASFEHLNRTVNALGLANLYTGLEKAKSADGVKKVKDAGATARAADGNATKVLLKKEDTTQLKHALDAEGELAKTAASAVTE